MHLLEIIWFIWGKQQQASCSSTGYGSAGHVGQLQSKHYYSSSPGPGEVLQTCMEESHISRELSSSNFLQLPGMTLRPPNSHTFSKDTVNHQWAVFSHKLSNRLWGGYPLSTFTLPHFAAFPCKQQIIEITYSYSQSLSTCTVSIQGTAAEQTNILPKCGLATGDPSYLLDLHSLSGPCLSISQALPSLGLCVLLSRSLSSELSAICCFSRVNFNI